MQLLAGGYAAERLTPDPTKQGEPVTFRAAPGAVARFDGRLTLAGVSNVVLEGLELRTQDQYWDLLVDACTSNVTLRHVSGRRFHINEGVRNVAFIGGSWGAYGSPGEADSSIGTSAALGPSATCNGAPAGPAQSITFDGITWHDVFWGVPREAWGGSHPDCFEINGNVDGVVIRNSRFEHCGDSFFAIYADQGDSVNITVEHSTFLGLGNYAYYGIQMGNNSSHSHGCGNFAFRNNVYWPDNPQSAGYAYSPIVTTCTPLPGRSPTSVTDNVFQRAPIGFDCGKYVAGPFSTVWSNNVFASGKCGTAAPLPTGYTLAGGSAVPSASAKAIRAMYAKAANNVSPAKIAVALRKAKLGWWSAARIRLLLANPVYRGGYYGAPGTQTALVSAKTWAAAQKVLKR